MRKVKRLMAIILCLSLVFCTLGFVSVSASDSSVTDKDYEPGNPNAIFATFTENSATKAAIHLSWVNPKADTLKEIRIYGDRTYGENKFDTLITTISDPTPGAVLDYDVKKIGGNDLTQNTYYTYRIVYVFEDRQTEVLVSSRARTDYFDRTLRSASSGVTIDYTMDNIPGMTQQIVNDADGGYLKLSANVNASNTAYRCFKFHIGSGKLTASTTYKVKITYKSDSDLNLGVFDLKKNTEWTTIEKEVTSLGSGKIVLFADWVNSFYNLCIKKVEVYTIPAEGEAVLADSYDCSVYNIKPTQVGNITTALENSELSFNISASDSWWWNTGNDGVAHTVTYYNIYEVINGEKFLRAKLARNAMSITDIPVTLHNVSDGTHTYEVTCSTEAGLESPAKTVSVTVLPYEPKNVMSNQQTVGGAAGVNVSWINPVATTLSKVSIYDVNTADGTETLLSDELDTTAAKTVRYTHTGLTAGDVKTYRVQFDYTNHKSVEVYTSAVATTNELKKIVTNKDNYLYGAVFSSDTGTSVPGMTNRLVTEGTNHYVEIKTNVVDNTSEKPNFAITTTGAMQGWYKLTFKAKSEAALLFDISLSGVNWIRNTDVSIPASSDWQTISCSVAVPSYAYSMVMIFKDTVESFCIDDIKIEPLTGANAVTADQNFENIGLKSGDAFPERVGGVTTVPSNGAASMVIANSSSWWHAATDFNENIARVAMYYNIYEDVNGIKVHRARLMRYNITDNVPKITLKGLTNGKTYTYYVTCEDDKGVLESEPVTVTVTPQGEVVVSEYALKGASGDAASVIEAGQTYSVSVTVDNSTGVSAGAQLIVAVYDGNELVATYLSTAKSVGGNANETLEVTGVQIPANASDKAELKCFVWENLNSLTPLCGATTYTK